MCLRTTSSLNRDERAFKFVFATSNTDIRRRWQVQAPRDVRFIFLQGDCPLVLPVIFLLFLGVVLRANASFHYIRRFVRRSSTKALKIFLFLFHRCMTNKFMCVLN